MDFWHVYDLYHRPVNTFISRMVGDSWTAEDLTQETFIKVQKNLGGLREDSKILPWIYRIARNVCLDYFRSRSKKEHDRDDIDQLQISIQPIAQVKLEQSQMSQCVQDKVYMLPEPLRDVLILSEIRDLSQKEIAEILEISTGNVKVRLHRAKNALKEILERDCDFERDERSIMVCSPKEASGNQD